MENLATLWGKDNSRLFKFAQPPKLALAWDQKGCLIFSLWTHSPLFPQLLPRAARVESVSLLNLDLLTKRKQELELDHSRLSSLSSWQKNVLLALMESQKSSPSLVTYQELARRTRTHPRLVARALALNPFNIIIPCHRVISQKGIGGYQGGPELKSLILTWEGLLTTEACPWSKEKSL